MIEFAKLIENATDALDQTKWTGRTDASTQIEIAKVYALLALAMATRGG